MSIIVVERNFPSAPSDADLQAVAERLVPCMQTYNVTWKRSLLSADRLRMVCEYEAGDAESVRKVQREAAAHFDKAWVATPIV